MKTKSRENLVATIVIVIMVALLVGLTNWRWSETQAHSQWVDLVGSVPSVTHKADTAIRDAKAAIHDAAQTGVDGPLVETLKIGISETETLKDEYSALLNYAEIRPKVDTGVPAVLDPFEVDTDDDTQLEVIVPASFRRDTTSYRKVRKRLEVSVANISESTTALNEGVVELKADAKTKWNNARKGLEDEIQKASDLVAVETTYVADSDLIQELIDSITSRQQLLDKTKTIPSNIKVIEKQTKELNQAVDALKKKNKAVSDSIEEQEEINRILTEEAARIAAEEEAARFAAEQQDALQNYYNNQDTEEYYPEDQFTTPSRPETVNPQVPEVVVPPPAPSPSPSPEIDPPDTQDLPGTIR